MVRKTLFCVLVSSACRLAGSSGPPVLAEYPRAGMGTAGPADSAENPLFRYTRTEALSTVVLRDDHENIDCRSPSGFLERLRAVLRETDLGAGTCTVAVLSPTDESGTSLEYRCPLELAGPLCTDYFEAAVWLELELEDGPKPYVATYSLVGVSKGYRKCKPDPMKPAFVNEQAVRKIRGDSYAGSRAGALFERYAAVCR